MLTLTYAPGVDWEPGHIRTFTHRARVWFRRQRQTMRYQWTLELTKKGVVHYHALVFVPRHLMLPTPDKRGWWSHGCSNVVVARNGVGYLAKYASKGIEGDHEIPRCARICGGGGLEPAATVELRWWMTPRWFRDRVPEITDCRRVPGGGYVVTDTGELIESPWRFVGFTAGFSQLLFVVRNSDERPSPPLACAD